MALFMEGVLLFAQRDEPQNSEPIFFCTFFSRSLALTFVCCLFFISLCNSWDKASFAGKGECLNFCCNGTKPLQLHSVNKCSFTAHCSDSAVCHKRKDTKQENREEMQLLVILVVPNWKRVCFLSRNGSFTFIEFSRRTNKRRYHPGMALFLNRVWV